MLVKIDLLKNLRKWKSEVSAAITQEIISTLNAFRDIRNRFAHYPVTFVPEKGEGAQQTLVAELACRDRDIRLDEAFFKDYDSRFGELERHLQTALRQMQTAERNAPARHDPGE